MSTKSFTATEVRKNGDELFAHNAATTRAMLHAYANRLEADEKAEPIYQWQHRPMHHPEYWKDCRNKEEWDHKRNSLPEAVFRIVYTNPSSADAERLAEALHNLRDAQKHYMEHRTSASEIREPLGQLVAQRAAEADAVLATYSAQVQPPYHECIQTGHEQFWADPLHQMRHVFHEDDMTCAECDPHDSGRKPQ